MPFPLRFFFAKCIFGLFSDLQVIVDPAEPAPLAVVEVIEPLVRLLLLFALVGAPKIVFDVECRKTFGASVFSPPYAAEAAEAEYDGEPDQPDEDEGHDVGLPGHVGQPACAGRVGEL